MQRAIPINPKLSFQKGGLKPNFLLYKERTGAPVIVNVDIDNTTQYTAQQTTLTDGDGNFTKVIIDGNRIGLLQGTAFTLSIRALDPENLENPQDVSNLRFKWLKNGSYIYSVNNLNGYKGYNTIAFTSDQCTQELTGIYVCEVVNESGTTTTAQLNITVYNRLNVPELYNNLIQNSSGELGLDNWTVVNGVTVNEFAPTIGDTKNFASILIDSRLQSSNGEYYSTQPELPFRFCSSNNWINFDIFYKNWKQGTLSNILDTFYGWWYANNKPNLVANEDPGDDFGCFYPSKRYIDDYNDNNSNGKIGLMHEMAQAKTYFTKPPIQRGGESISRMTQAIDVSNIDLFIDGKVCGVQNIVGNLFAYVGLGISSYEFRVKFGTTYTAGPADQALFDGISNKFYNVQLEGTAISGIKRMTQVSTTNASIGERGFTDQLLSSQIRTRDLANLQIIGGVAVGYSLPYQPPAWTHNIIRELYDESFAKGGANGDFVRLFNNFVFSSPTSLTAEQKSKYQRLEQLPILTHPDLTNGNTTRRQAAQNAVTAAYSQRMLATEDLILNAIVQPLNDLFNINLTGLRPLDGENYEALKLLIHTIVSQHLVDFINPNGTALLSDLINSATYLRARDLAKSFNSAIQQPVVLNSTNPVEQFTSYYNYLYSAMQFYIYENLQLGAITNEYVVAPSAPDQYLNTLVLDFKGLKQMAELGNGGIESKYDLTRATQIDIIPKCNDKLNFEVQYVDAFGEPLGTETINGPIEDDIFAVKDKTFLSTIVTKLFQKTTKLPDQPIPVTYKGMRELFQLYKYAFGSGQEAGFTIAQEFLRQNYPADYFAALANNNYPISDQGAAAFFAVNKTITIPKLTRTINVTATFDHTSVAFGLESDSGVNRYDSSEIQAEHLTDKLKFYKSGNPRAGLAHVKLCLYDGSFKRTGRYPNYFVPKKHVWSELRSVLKSQVITELDQIRYSGADWESFVYYQPNRESLSATPNPQPPTPPTNTTPQQPTDASIVLQQEYPKQ